MDSGAGLVRDIAEFISECRVVVASGVGSAFEDVARVGDRGDHVLDLTVRQAAACDAQYLPDHVAVLIVLVVGDFEILISLLHPGRQGVLDLLLNAEVGLYGRSKNWSTPPSEKQRAPVRVPQLATSVLTRLPVAGRVKAASAETMNRTEPS